MKYLPMLGNLLKKFRRQVRITLSEPEGSFPTFIESVKFPLLPWWVPIRDLSEPLKATHKNYIKAKESAASLKQVMEIQSRTLEGTINQHGLSATQAIQSEKDCGVFKVMPSADKVCKISLHNDLQLIIQDKGKQTRVLARKKVVTVKTPPRGNNQQKKGQQNQQNQQNH